MAVQPASEESHVAHWTDTPETRGHPCALYHAVNAHDAPADTWRPVMLGGPVTAPSLALDSDAHPAAFVAVTTATMMSPTSAGART
jgi:hypothetical protein